MNRTASVQTFEEFREKESRNSLATAVTEEGSLLEYETLVLRVNPPNVEIDNQSHESETIITVDSANRPGTLVEVVQCLTENNLVVKGAEISSDGGWFVDVFNVTELSGSKVTDSRKLAVIRKVLDIEYDCEKKAQSGTPNDEESGLKCTVFELAGKDRLGLLHAATDLLTSHGLDVRSLAAWTQRGRGAIVIFALEKGKPIQDTLKTEKLRRQLDELLNEKGIVNIKTVTGLPHHERRLHALLLQEVERNWNESQREKGSSRFTALPISSPSHPPRYSSMEPPEVTINYWPRLNYWRVTILCKDRPKLFFDTLCTLSDMNYDVYHASVCDAKIKRAFQDFYVRPRFGDVAFNKEKAAKLEFMLHASINRRFPGGLKVHVLTMDQIGLLAKLTKIFREADMSVTRAKVRTLSNERGMPTNHAIHTFYLVDTNGGKTIPTRADHICKEAGGVRHDALTEDKLPQGILNPKTDNQFYFSIPPQDTIMARFPVGSPLSSAGSM
ncbi:hypothetical protein BSKO_03750 [Bryopsis sp. KO-2023]|nr:hypothetical protein BSKO_03750 [Bryopsis sp. KO-2023]